MAHAKIRILLSAALLAVVLGCNTQPKWTATQKSVRPAPESADVPLASTPDIQVVEVDEVDIVEKLHEHRDMYKRSLVVLRDFYEERGYITKQQWAEAELRDVGKVKPFKYILSAEIPVTSLRPIHAIPEADAMYERGLELMRKGGHGVPALYRQDMMAEALAVFTELITRYPSSDKIDDAAFCCGEIHKEYFRNQELIAVRWYDRARTWDPNTPHPALFQAAVVYDFRLHDRARALEYYQRVLEQETGNKSNTAFASRRIHELTQGMNQLESPRRLSTGSASAATPPSRPRGGARPVQSMQPTRSPQSGASWRGGSAARADAGSTQPTNDELIPVINLGPDDD